jgi:hypothetical protein
MSTSAVTDRQILAYDPFFGDETHVRELSDKMLVTRKPHTCQICWDPIPPKTRVRALTEINLENRVVGTFYFCPSCCTAMATANDDNGAAIERRTQMGIRRAEESRR